jgi:hypothetical protein
VRYLLKLLDDAVRGLIDIFRPKQAFSWQTALFLCLFSWAMAWASVENLNEGLGELLPADSPTEEPSGIVDSMLPVTRALFTMGWIFLTISVGWLLAKEKIKIPILDITLKPAIWVTSALTSAFLFEIWNPETLSRVLISWPLIFAAYAALSKVFVISDNRFTMPKSEVRQQIVITTLICLVVSCWFRFHFVVQRWIFEDYAVLQLVDFRNNTFAVQVGESPPILDIAQWTLQRELGVLLIPEARWWFRNADENVSELNDQFRQNLQDSGETVAWEIALSATRISDPEFLLQILPTPEADLESEPANLSRDNTDDQQLNNEQSQTLLTPASESSDDSLLDESQHEFDVGGDEERVDRIGLERPCQLRPTSELSQNELAVRSEQFEAFLARLGTLLPSSPPQEAPEGIDNTGSVESRSLAERLWDWLLSFLGIGNESPTESGEEESITSLDDIQGVIQEGVSSLLGRDAEPERPRSLEDYPSQVVCEADTALFLEPDL